VSWNTFEIVYVVGFAGASLIRKFYHYAGKPNRTKKSCQGLLDTLLLAVASLGFLLPLLHLFTGILSFADYDLPTWIGWAGTAVYAFAIGLLWKSHADLGRNFAPVLRIGTAHTLVTGGIYAYVRHPMYLAHIIWAVAQVMLLGNWVAGPAFLATSWPLYLLRLRMEERMMLEEFGDEYEEYQQRTARLVPKVEVLKTRWKAGCR